MLVFTSAMNPLIRLLNLILITITAAPFGLRAEVQIEHLDVGDALPTGEVRTDEGNIVAVQNLVAEKPAVLVFYRGGWCIYCSRHLAALADIVPALDDMGFQILAISPDRPAKLREKPKFENLPYTLLSDSSMTVSQSFGITFKVEDERVAKFAKNYGIDLEGDSGETHHLLPHPSVFIVDSGGIIRFAHVDPNYRKRLDPEEIQKAADGVLRDEG